MNLVNETLSIERTPDGGLAVRMTTALGSMGGLEFTKLFPRGAGLSQHRVLELQTDLMQEALRLLETKVKAARLLDCAAPSADE